MSNAFDTTGPSIFTTNKTKADVSREVQAKLHKKPRGREAPIKGRGPIKNLNANLPKGVDNAKT